MPIKRKQSPFFKKARGTKRKTKFLFYFIILIALTWLLFFFMPSIHKFINVSVTTLSIVTLMLHNAWDWINRNVVLLALGVLTLIACYIFLKILFRKKTIFDTSKKRNRSVNECTLSKREAKILEAAISDSRHDYIIEENDYRRGNKKEHAYRKYFNLSLLKIFDNSCAKCKRSDNGIEIDHFFLSKNEGGCFVLRHKKGHIINNAIPLCISCNRSKSDKNYKNFFTDDELKTIFEKNVRATKAINQLKFLEKIKPKPLFNTPINTNL